MIRSSAAGPREVNRSLVQFLIIKVVSLDKGEELHSAWGGITCGNKTHDSLIAL